MDRSRSPYPVLIGGGDWAAELDLSDEPGSTVERLSEALDIIEKINFSGRKSLVDAVAQTIAHDGKMVVAEAELLRAICASLECPLPPVLSAA